MMREWRIYTDTGGTFTDVLALDPDGRLHRAKVLTSGALRGVVEERTGARTFRVSADWGAAADVLRGGTFHLLGGRGRAVKVACFDPVSRLLETEEDPGSGAGPGDAFEVRTGEEAPVLAARLLTGTPAEAALPPVTLRLGTTLATNALLTGKGAETALFVTRGFGDLLEIGTQARPDLFAIEIEKTRPLYARVVEVPERVSAAGTVLEPLDLDALEEKVETLLAADIRTAAVALLHADRYPGHEEELTRFLQERGFSHVSRSSAMSRTIRLLPRAVTTVVDAWLTPVVAAYLDAIRAALAGGRLLVMSSAGGLAGPEHTRPKDMLLSGPAGGVVGASHAGRAAGFTKVISFDMGGTSTDVARCDGDFEYVFEHRVGDAHLFAPALAVETVAAGGGSVCGFDGERLFVGPESAGADPGPACYGAGGPLTLTDVNLLLGRLDPPRFGIPVREAPARAALDAVLKRMEEARGDRPEPEAVLEGFLELADERMAGAVRRISLRRGYDPAEYALVAFGGAGGQHACAVAERLGIRTVVIPPDAGLLSAWGLAAAAVERFAEAQVLEPLHTAASRVPILLDGLVERAAAALTKEGLPREAVMVRRRIAALRFEGQETTLQVEIPPAVFREGADPARRLAEAFLHRYQAVYGHTPVERAMEVVSLRVVASSRPGEDAPPVPAPARGRTAASGPRAVRRARFHGRWERTPCFDREDLPPGAALITGPALVFEAHSAVVVPPGWSLSVDPKGPLVLTRRSASRRDALVGGMPGRRRPEAVEVELFTHRFETLAREMGEALRRTAVSTNVKERLDFSCALLDPEGNLVVNAPHIPVHLGSLGLCVRAVTRVLPLREGDGAVTNHPAFGGSHLPDLTVITPVFTRGALIGYTAARAHHAELGGCLPGSMPAAATCLAEEGVVIPPMYAVEGGKPRWDRVEAILRAPPHPSRAPADNLADLKAALAACRHGALGLRHLAEAHGPERMRRYMAALEDRAARRMAEALEALPDGRYEAEERLDDGTPLHAAVSVHGKRARVDFTGSGPVHPGNLNATEAVVRSVVIYVLRLLVQEPLPLNEGLLRPVEVVLPEGILNPPFPQDPRRAPAVVGGNVETSQRLVDTLLKALRLCAGSQGTMNNVVFGNDRFSYYETVCGGCGAGPGFRGADAVHSHMTNTRITDPELLEARYPVRLERFALRRGSGGAGRFHGGDGVVREIRFLEPLSLSLLTQRRMEGPFGMAGGRPGAPGRQRLFRSDGTVEGLASVDTREVRPGDRLVLETPGGGGYGPP